MRVSGACFLCVLECYCYWQGPKVDHPPHGRKNASGTFSTMTRTWDNTRHDTTCQPQKGQHQRPQIYYPSLFPTTTICCHHILCQVQHHLCHILYDLSVCHLVMYTLAPATNPNIATRNCPHIFFFKFVPPPCSPC